jgi:ABC-type spermidine/putrescine transport system permease subunit II
MTRGKRSTAALQAYTVLVFVFLYAPILALVAFSFNAGKSQAVWKGFTWNWYAVALRNERIVDCVKSSFIVAAATTIVVTVVGTLAGLGLARRFPGRGTTAGLIYLPILIPEIVLGVSLLTLFVPVLGWQPSPWTMIIAHSVFTLSYVAIVVRARLAGFDRTLEEAARDLGAGPMGVFWRVKFPLILPGVAAGALLAFTVSVDDYVITSLVYPPGWQTLPLYIYSEVKRGVTPEVNAVSTLLLAVTVVMILAAQWLTGSSFSTSSTKERA